jgi:hypothetical protein
MKSLANIFFRNAGIDLPLLLSSLSLRADCRRQEGGRHDRDACRQAG